MASTRALGTAAELLHAIAQAEKDYADALRRQAYLYLVSALLTVAVITLLGWSTARRVARKIIRPLERLAVSVRQAEQGVAKVDLEGEGVLEVQALARQLQALLRAQTEHVDVIERNRELLEHRVAERTDELVPHPDGAENQGQPHGRDRQHPFGHRDALFPRSPASCDQQPAPECCKPRV